MPGSSEEVMELRGQVAELEDLLGRVTTQLAELSPRAGGGRRASPSRDGALPERMEVAGLSGFESQTSGGYVLSYYRDAPAPKQASVVYEREQPNSPAFLVYEHGTWSIRSAVDSPNAYLRALSSIAANPASLPATAWEMSCPGKSPHPWLPAPKSFTVAGYSETVGSRGDELYESPRSERLSLENSLDGLNDDEWRRVVAHRRERRQHSSQLVEPFSESRWDDSTAHQHRQRETALEREARMARRGPRRRASPARRDRSPAAATTIQQVDRTGARWAQSMNQDYPLKVASPTRSWNASVETRESYVSPRRVSHRPVANRVEAGNSRSLYTHDYLLQNDLEVRARNRCCIFVASMCVLEF